MKGLNKMIFQINFDMSIYILDINNYKVTFIFKFVLIQHFIFKKNKNEGKSLLCQYVLLMWTYPNSFPNPVGQI